MIKIKHDIERYEMIKIEFTANDGIEEFDDAIYFIIDNKTDLKDDSIYNICKRELNEYSYCGGYIKAHAYIRDINGNLLNEYEYTKTDICGYFI